MNRMLVERYPQYADTIPIDVESDYSEEDGFYRMVRFSNEKLLSTFPDFSFIPVEQTLVDMFNSLISNGIVDMLRDRVLAQLSDATEEQERIECKETKDVASTEHT